MLFNPDNIQADCSEFLTFILDHLHEELTSIYVSNQPVEESKQKDSWNETADKNQKIVFNNTRKF